MAVLQGVRAGVQPAVLLQVLLMLVVVVVLQRAYRRFKRFRRLELAIPGPASLPILGNMLDLLNITSDTLLTRLVELWDHRTQMSRITMPSTLALIVSDPVDIQKVIKMKETQDKSEYVYGFFRMLSWEGLVTLNGSRWRAHRKAFLPAFHHEVIDKYADVFSEECRRFVERCRPGVEVDVGNSIHRLAAASFMRTALVSKVDESEVSTFISFLEVCTSSIALRIPKPWLWSDLVFGLTPTGQLHRRLRDSTVRFASRIIHDRRAKLRHQQQRREGSVKKRRTLIDILVDPVEGVMTDAEILDEFLIFSAAAVETTSTTLGWTLKVISIRHDVQDKLRREMVEVVGDGNPVEPQHLSRLEYTERVLKESMRLLPPIPVLARTNNREVEFNGFTIPKGSVFGINIYGVHRNPLHWPDPLVFDPDRFLPQNSEGRHACAFMPFSVGPRNCIGSRYGMMLMKTMLATLLLTYSVDPADDGLNDPATFPMTTDVASRMVGGVRVVFNLLSSQEPRQTTN